MLSDTLEYRKVAKSSHVCHDAHVGVVVKTVATAPVACGGSPSQNFLLSMLSSSLPMSSLTDSLSLVDCVAVVGGAGVGAGVSCVDVLVSSTLLSSSLSFSSFVVCETGSVTASFLVDFRRSYDIEMLT